MASRADAALNGALMTGVLIFVLLNPRIRATRG
jgi:hypothetical protein